MRKTIILLFILMLCSAANAATYYVDPVDGDDAGLGSQSQPWKTMSFTISNQSGIAAGDTVKLMSGNYGTVTFGKSVASGGTTVYGTSWDAPITYEAATGETPVFYRVDFYSATSGEASVKRYVILNGIDFYVNAAAVDVPVSIIQAANLKIINCKLRGIWNGTTYNTIPIYGVKILNKSLQDINDITIQDCNIYNIKEGINIAKYGTSYGDIKNINIVNTEIHQMAGSGIGIAECDNNVADNVIIDGCKIYNRDALDGTSGFSHGSGLAIRSHGVTIKNTIVRDQGGTNLLHTYEDIYSVDGYQNIAIENCLFYDGQNSVAILLTDIGENLIFRNNTVIGKELVRVNADTTCDAVDRSGQINRYDTVFALEAPTSGADANTIQIFNNVFVGKISFSGTGLGKPYAFKEDNNIIFSMLTAALTGTTPPYLVGDDTLLVGYATTDAAIPTWIHDVNYFEDSNNFFVGGTDFDTWSYWSDPACDVGSHGVNLDSAYQLYADSNAIGLADSNYTATDLLGVTRDATPDAGAYEYVADTNYVLAAPTSLTATAVSASQIDLAWTDNASDEYGYRIYRGTDDLDPNALIATVSGTAYSDTGLTASTDYHYYIFAYNAQANSANSNEANAVTSAAPADPTPIAGVNAIILPMPLEDVMYGDNVTLTWYAGVTGGKIAVYRNDNAVGLKGTSGLADVNGITDIRGFNGLTGINSIRIDTGFSSSFYQRSSAYSIILEGGTYDSNSVNTVLGRFTIEKAYQPEEIATIETINAAVNQMSSTTTQSAETINDIDATTKRTETNSAL